MSGATGQAAGMAIGAAVGSLVGQPIAGAALGGGSAGLLQSSSAASTQYNLDMEAIKLNREAARLKAAEASAIHAANFRQALASQIASASMRGGSGSLVTQFASEAFKNFNLDQRAIDTGLQLSEAQSSLLSSGAAATRDTRNLSNFSNFVNSSLSGINFNLTKPRVTNG